MAGRRERLQKLVAFAAEQLRPHCGVAPSGSQIQPVIVGANERATRLASAMQARGFDIRAIRPPTVPEGTARLRVSVTLNVTEEHVATMATGLGRGASEASAMRPCFIVTGTDTDIGKTVFAAALVRALDGAYWKPSASGFDRRDRCKGRAAAVRTFARSHFARSVQARDTGFTAPGRQTRWP